MFKLLYRPQEADPDPGGVVAEASNRLDVGEFQLFQLGYEHWYGRRPAPETIEPYFFAYLSEDETPAWARHFARKIIAMDDKGDLRATAPEYHRYDRVHPAPARWIGWCILLGTLGVVALFLVLVMLSDQDPGYARCVFPPCP